MMTSYGINTLISDSGVMKYRIVAERWEVNDVRIPPRWIFHRGLFMEQFDEKFHVEAYVQSDTAFYYTTKKLWHLIGNVRVMTVDGIHFHSEELYWDQEAHELYSNVFSKIITPERELQGTYFRSDEQLRHYTVSNSKGSFNREDADGKKDDGKKGSDKKDSSGSSPETTTDSVPKRAPASPYRKR